MDDNNLSERSIAVINNVEGDISAYSFDEIARSVDTFRRSFLKFCHMGLIQDPDTERVIT